MTLIWIYFDNRIQPFEAANIAAAFFFWQINDEA